MKPSAGLLIVPLLLACPQARSHTVVKSLSYVETRASFRARFPNPLSVGRNAAENLAMLRHARKTEIYSVSATDGKRALLFSDEGTNFELKAKGAVSPTGKA
jgi:hypothetical protein